MPLGSKLSLMRLLTPASASAWGSNTSTAARTAAGARISVAWPPMAAAARRIAAAPASSDGGRTWHPTLKSDVMFGPVAWVPKKPNVAYVVGFDRSVWRTVDGGKSWAKVA